MWEHRFEWSIASFFARDATDASPSPEVRPTEFEPSGGVELDL